MIPFTNTAARTAGDRPLIMWLIDEAAATGEFILKRNVVAFETMVREFTGAAEAVAVASGSDGLKLGLSAVGVGRGDEVLVPALGFHAIANVVHQLGAVPVFADVDPLTGCLTSTSVEDGITPRAKAILPAHTLNSHADMPAIRTAADRAGVPVVEDAAVCIGSKIGNRSAGRWGTVGVFSTYPIKPLGGIGEGGVIVTDDPAAAKRCRMLRNHGQDGVTRFLHHVVGYNARMDEIVAGYLVAKAPGLPAALQRRAEIAAAYSAAFAPLAPAITLPPAGNARSAWFTFTVLTTERDQLRQWLGRRGIGTRVSYTPLLPFHPAFATTHRPGEFPGAERFAARHLSLPLYPELTNDQVAFIAGAVREFFATGGAESPTPEPNLTRTSPWQCPF